MCGIVGFIGRKPAAPLLLEGLAELEYRGYDSAGIALVGSAGVEIYLAGIISPVVQLGLYLAHLFAAGAFLG